MNVIDDLELVSIQTAETLILANHIFIRLNKISYVLCKLQRKTNQFITVTANKYFIVLKLDQQRTAMVFELGHKGLKHLHINDMFA
jgi:hypothetical protein